MIMTEPTSSNASLPSLDVPVLGYDVGGTQLRVALVKGAEILAERKIPSSGLSPEALAIRAAELAQEVERESQCRAVRAGVGIAAMLPIPSEVIENAPNLGWVQVPFRRLLSEALDGRPVTLANDVDAAAYGEGIFGAGQGAQHLACVFVGTGIGSGIVVDGKLLRGFRGVAAELGHIKVVAEGGRDCYCGQKGCFEAYAGGRALLERIHADLEQGKANGVRERMGAGALSLSIVDEAAADGDPYADVLWREVGDLLGTHLANLCTVLNPEVLILGGGVWVRCPDLQSRVHKRIRNRLNHAASVGFRVVDAALGDNAGILGAAKLATDLAESA